MNAVVGDDANWSTPAAELGFGERIEPTSRRIRTTLFGRTIAVSDAALLHVVFGPPLRDDDPAPQLPGYFFPFADVDMTLLKRSDVLDGRQWWTATVDGATMENVAWSFTEPAGSRAGTRDHLTFSWGRMAAWFEEAEEVFEHARDPQHRVDAIRSERSVQVRHGELVLAESSSAHFVFETGLPVRYYLPRHDVRLDLLDESALVTRCPYKGTSRYWSVRGADADGRDVAWSYDDPIPELPQIRELIAFYGERLDIVVDGALIDRPISPWS